MAAGGCPEVPEPTGTPCYEVAIRGFAFDPPSLTVSTVARIVFTNEDAAPHSIEWADGTPASPSLGNGASTERQLMGVPAGTISYVCGIHGASMSGEIVVDDTIPVP
jgi:plastocyanin